MELSIDLRLIFAILNGKVSTAISRKLQQNFTTAEINLTTAQWTVLLYLAERDGVSQQQLCAATFKDKPAMTRIITAMENNGFVRRSVNRDNRRANIIHLTPQGRIIKQRAQRVADQTLRKALRGLDQDALVTSQEVLRRIFSNTTTE
jgi:DNA-binding MarR family transcriptional regulator